MDFPNLIVRILNSSALKFAKMLVGFLLIKDSWNLLPGFLSAIADIIITVGGNYLHSLYELLFTPPNGPFDRSNDGVFFYMCVLKKVPGCLEALVAVQSMWVLLVKEWNYQRDDDILRMAVSVKWTEIFIFFFFSKNWTEQSYWCFRKIWFLRVLICCKHDSLSIADERPPLIGENECSIESVVQESVELYVLLRGLLLNKESQRKDRTWWNTTVNGNRRWDRPIYKSRDGPSWSCQMKNSVFTSQTRKVKGRHLTWQEISYLARNYAILCPVP